MARGRTGAVLLVLALAAICVGTVATLLSKGGPGRKTSPVRRVDEPARAGTGAPVRIVPTRREGNLWVRVLLQPGGTPVAGAEVLLQDHEGVWAADTDAAGEASFPVRKGTPVLLRARGKGLLGPSICAWAMEQQESPYLLHVSRPASLEGTVRVRATRAPVEGARVRVTENELVQPAWSAVQPAPELAGEKREIASDAEGRFRVEGLAGAAGCVVIADREGFASSKVHAVPASPEPGGLEILLDPGTRVRGTARDRAGRPVEGVRVSLDESASPGAYSPPRSWTVRIYRPVRFPGGGKQQEGGQQGEVTGPDGQYAFEGRPGGRTLSLYAEKEGWAVVEGAGRVSLPEAGGDVVRDLVLDRTGEVLLGWSVPGGTSPERATVEVRPLDDEFEPWTYLQFRRGERIRDLRPGGYRFTVLSEVAGQGEIEIDVGGGVSTEAEVVLGAGSGIDGEVVGPDGAPIAGALVHLMTPGSPPRQAASKMRHVGVDAQGTAVVVLHHGTEPGDPMVLGANNVSRTDASGRFRFVGLRPGSAWGLRASAPGHARAYVDGVAVPATGARIVLARTGTITGRLDLPPGAATPRTVSIYHLTGSSTEDVFLGTLRSTAAFGDGRFRVEEIPPGPGILVFRTGDATHGGSATIEVPAGGERDAGEILLGGGVSLRGRVVDASGAPVPVATVHLDMLGFRQYATAGPDGAFAFEDVPEGQVRLRASLPRETAPTTPGVTGTVRVAGFTRFTQDTVVAEVRVVVAKGGPAVLLAFPPFGVLRGTVPGPARTAAPARARVHAFRTDGGAEGAALVTFAGPDGHFTFRVPVGTYRVEAHALSGADEVIGAGEAVVPDGGEGVVQWKEPK